MRLILNDCKMQNTRIGVWRNFLLFSSLFFFLFLYSICECERLNCICHCCYLVSNEFFASYTPQLCMKTTLCHNTMLYCETSFTVRAGSQAVWPDKIFQFGEVQFLACSIIHYKLCFWEFRIIHRKQHQILSYVTYCKSMQKCDISPRK